MYAIFRVGKKYKSMSEIEGFERHTERKQYTANADVNIKNKILIGSKDISQDAEDYLKYVKLRKNSVLARDLLLTASPEFFQDQEAIDKWASKNIEWLQEQFGENLRYCSLHLDETTPHLHCLLLPKFYDQKRDKYILSNTRLFNGAKALSEWQDKYSEAMKDFNLQRGVKWSKAKHIDIKTFYSLVNAELKEQDLNSLTAKAKNGELLNIKIKSLQKTLNTYKDFNKKTDLEKEEIKRNNKYLFRQVEEIKKDKDIYKECIKTMSELYKIPPKDIVKVLEYVTNKSKGTDQERNK